MDIVVINGELARYRNINNYWNYAMIKQCVFIVGTDTDVGKTIVISALARTLHRQGENILLLKPIQTGCRRKADESLEAPDVCVYKEAVPTADIRVCLMFESACSPHLAAQREGLLLSAKSIAKSIEDAVKDSQATVILIEGSGGLLTPLNEKETIADVFTILARSLKYAIPCSMLFVIANKLGAINHALLSIAIARNHGFSIIGFVMAHTKSATHDNAVKSATCNDIKGATHIAICDNAPNNIEAHIHTDNVQCIAKMSNVPCLGHVQYNPLLQHDNPILRQKAWDTLADDVKTVVSFMQQVSSPIEHILEYDHKHIWHPYTSALNPSPVWEAVSTQGVHIRLRDGRELIDGMASWWCAIHGYNHPELLEALHRQASLMPHVMFGGLTHKPAVDLAQKLLAVVPKNLEHVFFADSGSVAVEVALKMAVQYQQAIGNSKRTHILAFKGAYHGDTLGAMSVCDPENSMHSLFAGIIPQHFFAPRPDCPFHMPYNPASIAQFEAILYEQSANIAAVIIEPIVQGAGGMYFYHPDYLQKISQLCEKYGCLLILDEIATGFGRTGKYFACEHAKVQADIFCLGKGLTGGVLSFAATLASHKVAQGIASDCSATGGVLMHGPTFMGNPLACAVASASLDLLAEGMWKNSVQQIEKYLKIGLSPCLGIHGVKDVRSLGAIGVVEMHELVNVARLQRYFVDKWQVWIRPFSHLIYVMPSYCIEPEEIKILTSAICNAVEEGIWQ